MISLKRANQGGAVQTYFIIALLLAIVAIGVARYVEEHGAQVRRNQAIAQAEKQLKTDQDNTNTAKTDEGSGSAGVNSGQTAAPSQTSTNSSSTSSTATAPQQSSSLPTTGPSDDMVIRIFLAGLLTATIAAYVSSRRTLARSL